MWVSTTQLTVLIFLPNMAWSVCDALLALKVFRHQMPEASASMSNLYYILQSIA
jgi:hypothetical protein